MTPDSAPMVIGGEWLETRDPASGQIIGRVPQGTAADVDAAVRPARGTAGTGRSFVPRAWRASTSGTPS